MRNILTAIAVVAIVAFMFCATPAKAAEELAIKASTVEFKVDKNGKEYGMIRFDAKRKTGTLQYTESVLAVVPSWQTDALKTLKQVKPGQDIVIAGNWNTFNGNDSFKVKAIGISPTPTAKK